MNPKLNAVVELCSERALVEAKQADAAVAEHVGEVVLDAVERELHWVPDGELVDADDRVRPARMVDVVVVRLVLEAVEA